MRLLPARRLITPGIPARGDEPLFDYYEPNNTTLFGDLISGPAGNGVIRLGWRAKEECG